MFGRNTFVNVHVNKALTSHGNRHFCAQLHDYKNTINAGEDSKKAAKKPKKAVLAEV